jgi:N-acetylmuramoyl-L-alanine amidase
LPLQPVIGENHERQKKQRKRRQEKMLKTVLISAGHSQSDPGAVNGKYKEATLTLLMRDRIALSLYNKGVPTLTDGVDGHNDPLKKAIALANITQPLAVEIHFNSGSQEATGVECLSKPINMLLAQQLSKAVHDVLGIPMRGNEGWKPDNSGQHHRLGFCDAGGVILEVCFISNLDDMASYVHKKAEVAEAVAKVLARRAGWTG